MPYRFHQLLKNIGKACENSSLTEAEVEKIFQEHDFFLELGFDGIGKDILAQRPRAQKRYDFALLGFGGRVRTVIEFKKPKRANDSSLDGFSIDLFEKYVRPHSATVGVLTDGVRLILYFRVNGDFVRQFDFSLAEATETDARKLEDAIRKRRVDLESLASVQSWLDENRESNLRIVDSTSEPARIFFQVYQLRPESVFGRLVLRLKEILPESIQSSGFTRGSYEFWLKTYARDLKFKYTPRSWREFLLAPTSEEIARFSFALETAYTIVSRLILAKAADDQRFPGVRFLPRLVESYSELSTRNRLKPEDHLEVIGRSFQRAGETLFHSIFSQDIFDWWFETKNLDNRLLCLALGEAVLTIVQFDFLRLSGDLLGELYQLYFDRDTRKALGEFYTPTEVIEFILDECGYKGQRGERLLDPSCGSGSFLVAALKRYLQKNKGKGKEESVLRDLTEGLRLVGFDINPFAVLMSQVNYAALILPIYAEAVFHNPEFRILRLPVFRTDSLRLEEREIEEDTQKKDALTINLQFEERTLDVSVYLPITESKKRFVQMRIRVPRFLDARKKGLVGNLEEYVAALSLVFQAARDQRRSLPTLLKTRFGDRANDLGAYMTDVVEGLNSTVATLKGKYNDGRFLKTIEDLVLAVSLKQDMQYDYVVGNPPYVRIQKIPDHVKEYWVGKYKWAERNYDLYIPFMERAVQAAGQPGWLKDGGWLGFIVSDRFLNVDYGAKLREELPKALQVQLLIDFRDTRVFEGALNYPAILIGRRDGADNETEAARVFSSETPLPGLLKEFGNLRKKLYGDGAQRGQVSEVFSVPKSRLHAQGWWLMPREERRIFDKLRAASGGSLKQLSASASGGFAGYQTSADPILVFDQVEDCGSTLKLMPRHEPKHCGCKNEPVEIEKDALRPFLFGKDVKRWLIDWKQTWVMFPYDTYAKKQTLYDDNVIEGWNLIPSRENIEHFNFANLDSIETIEERFPKAWKYLRNHEDTLRGREHGRYAKGKKSDGLLWYGATYPRALEHYFRPKLVLQVLSRRPSMAMDEAGRFVFTAGGTAGVYGVALASADTRDLKSVAAVLNSSAADFQVKQISSVFGSRFYSYGDQFIEEIALPAKRDGLPKIVDGLQTVVSNWKHLITKTSEFPDSFTTNIAEYELDTIKRLCHKAPSAENLKIESEAIRIEQALYGFEVHFGNQSPFEFETREHAACLAEAFKSRRRQSISRKEVLGWSLPVSAAGAKKMLRLLTSEQEKLKRTEADIATTEDELNEVVYRLYGVTREEQEVIEGFLGRYSSGTAVINDDSESDEAEEEE